MYPLQLLMMTMSLATLLAISPQSSTAMGKHAPETPSPNAFVAPTSKWWCCSSGDEATGPAMSTEEPTHWKQKEGKFFMGLKENHQEAFHLDSNLVWVTRQRYFETHHPTFNQEGSHNLSGLFQNMITSAYLLDSEVYKIQEVWTIWKYLQCTHSA